MSGRLTINRIRDCDGLTIKMDGTKIIGDCSSLEINDIASSNNTKIFMRDAKVMTHDEYQRSLAKSSGYSGYSGGSGRHRSGGSAGTLTVNKIRDSTNTMINQDRIKISGNYDDVKLNDVDGASNTQISMQGADISIGSPYTSDSEQEEDSRPQPSPPPSSSSSDEDSDETPEDELDENGLPLPSTYAYHIAPKFTFNINLGNGANVTCTFLQKNKVQTIKEFVVELQPRYEGKNFRLQVVKSDPPKYLDLDPQQTLKEAGFLEKIELKIVMTSPESDH